MRDQIIHKPAPTERTQHNLGDYESIYRQFSWQEAQKSIAGLPGGRGVNIAYETVDRHADRGRSEHVALNWIAKDRSVRTITYGELKVLSARFASALERLGVSRGDRVFSLLGRVPELFVAALGTWKRGAVFCPLFSAFGPEPIRANAHACRTGTAQTLQPVSTPLYR